MKFYLSISPTVYRSSDPWSTKDYFIRFEDSPIIYFLFVISHERHTDIFIDKRPWFIISLYCPRCASMCMYLWQCLLSFGAVYFIVCTLKSHYLSLVAFDALKSRPKNRASVFYHTTITWPPQISHIIIVIKRYWRTRPLDKRPPLFVCHIIDFIL